MTEGNYSNVGHRGPVYKGLGAMNPCDLSITYSALHFWQKGIDGEPIISMQIVFSVA
jgi:hypothetical protein